jgi:predicted dehydrogenase
MTSGVGQVRAAVIGVGLIGEQHAAAYRAYSRSSLALVCDANEERARAAADRFGCAFTTRIEDVAESEVDVVSVATPDFAHFDPVMAMLRAGKHVLVEKPLATTLAEAEQMVETARERGVHLAVNLGNRWNPNYLSMRDALRAGEIGEPLMVYSRLSDTIWVPTRMLSWGSKSGPEWFLFAHSMDLVQWMLDQRPREVYALGIKRVLAARGIDAYDAIQAMVRFDSTFATFETSWVLPESWPDIVENELTINGERGRMKLDAAQHGFELSSDVAGRHLFTRPSRWTEYRLPPVWWETLRKLVDAVLDGGAPAITGESSLVSIRMIDAVERSIAEGKPISI